MILSHYFQCNRNIYNKFRKTHLIQQVAIAIMITSNSLQKGKIAELTIATRLLEQDFEPYLPIVDIKGIDLIVKHKNHYYELQVKARKVYKDKDTFIIQDLKQGPNYFLVCYDLLKKDAWYIPTHILAKKAKIVQGKIRWLVITSQILNELKEYKNNFQNTFI